MQTIFPPPWGPDLLLTNTRHLRYFSHSYTNKNVLNNSKNGIKIIYKHIYADFFFPQLYQKNIINIFKNEYICTIFLTVNQQKYKSSKNELK